MEEAKFQGIDRKRTTSANNEEVNWLNFTENTQYATLGLTVRLVRLESCSVTEEVRL